MFGSHNHRVGASFWCWFSIRITRTFKCNVLIYSIQFLIALFSATACEWRAQQKQMLKQAKKWNKRQKSSTDRRKSKFAIVRSIHGCVWELLFYLFFLYSINFELNSNRRTYDAKHMFWIDYCSVCRLLEFKLFLLSKRLNIDFSSEFGSPITVHMIQ